MLAPGPNGASPSGSRVHRPCSPTRAPRSCRSTCPVLQHLVCRADHCLRTATTSTSCPPASNPRWALSVDGRMPSPTAPRARHLGMGDMAQPNRRGAACAGISHLETLAAADSCFRSCPTWPVAGSMSVDIIRLPPDSDTRWVSGQGSWLTRCSPSTTGFIFRLLHGYPWLIHRLSYRRTNHHTHPMFAGSRIVGTTNERRRHGVLNDLEPLPPWS